MLLYYTIMKYSNEAQLLREQLAKMEIQNLERDYRILEIDYKIQRESSGRGMVDFVNTCS